MLLVNRLERDHAASKMNDADILRQVYKMTRQRKAGRRTKAPSHKSDVAMTDIIFT